MLRFSRGWTAAPVNSWQISRAASLDDLSFTSYVHQWHHMAITFLDHLFSSLHVLSLSGLVPSNPSPRQNTFMRCPHAKQNNDDQYLYTPRSLHSFILRRAHFSITRFHSTLHVMECFASGPLALFNQSLYIGFYLRH
jgi:hypothetical protein